VVLIVVFGIYVLQAQTVQGSASLFGVHLDEKALSLLTEVEQLYDKPIRAESLPVDDPMAGISKVGDDGTPIISINPSSGRRPDVIVHELYHFLLRTRGYPDIQWLFPETMDTHETRPDFRQISFKLYDPILHYVFYPEARARLGIDPGERFEQMTRQALVDEAITPTLAGMDAGAIVLAYYRLRLELDDRKLFQQLVELLENQGKHNEVAVGERLATIVERASPLSPISAVNALVGCLNIFYEGRYTFVQRPWTQRQLGTHTQHIAPLELRVARATTSHGK